MNKLKFKLLKESAKMPTIAYKGDAGIDVYYAGEDTVVHPHCCLNLSTGLSLEIPEGYYVSIKTRSSFAKKGIQMHDGTIDSSYTGEITVFTYNIGNLHVAIKKGEKLAQLVLHKVIDEIIDIEPLCNEARGDRGMGSSNKLERF